MKDKINYKKGYTLLFSIIVSSVVLSIAAFILSISRKQFILASVSRDSTMAIYVADSAIQCAVESYVKLGFDPLNNTGMTCNKQLFDATFTDIPLGDDLSIYDLINNPNNRAERSNLLRFDNKKSCATVTVIRGYDNKNQHKTIIEARGYSDLFSFPCSGISRKNSRNVERAIRLIYND